MHKTLYANEKRIFKSIKLDKQLEIFKKFPTSIYSTHLTIER